MEVVASVSYGPFTPEDRSHYVGNYEEAFEELKKQPPAHLREADAQTLQEGTELEDFELSEEMRLGVHDELNYHERNIHG